MNELIDSARALPDADLLARVATLAGQERGATAALIAHLAEVEARGLHLAAGYGSMFTYCCEALKLSEHAAYHRIEAARAVRRFPVVLDHLVEGALNLTTVKLLARHLTEANHLVVLESARGLSRSAVESLVAGLAPEPDVPVTLRKLPTPSPAARSAAPLLPPRVPEARDLPVAFDRSPATPATTGKIHALAPERFRLQLTIGSDTLGKLRRAKDLLRHAIPSGDEAQIIDRALTLLLADVERKKLGATRRPRRSGGTAAETRSIPAEVKRAVAARDQGRCVFLGTSGRLCGERAFLEFHHVRPFVEGGPATIENIELRCRRHNAYEWRRRATGYGQRDQPRSIQPPPRQTSPS